MVESSAAGRSPCEERLHSGKNGILVISLKEFLLPRPVAASPESGRRAGTPGPYTVLRGRSGPSPGI
eukprot:745954-Hanusia_phi.AAC.1